jgi:hypothetical protein
MLLIMTAMVEISVSQGVAKDRRSKSPPKFLSALGPWPLAFGSAKPAYAIQAEANC